MVSRTSRPVREAVSSVLRRRVVKSADERRKDILDAALDLFTKKGFNETTVDDIASGAGVAKGTIYLYFPSKEHILLGLKERFHEGPHAACADVLTEAVERIGRGEQIDYRDVIDDLFEAIVEYNVRQREALEVVVRQAPAPDLVKQALDMEKGFLQLLANVFRSATTNGMIDCADPEMTVYLVNAAIRDNVVTCLCYGEPDDLERIVAAAKDLLYKSFAPGVDLPPRRPRLV